jgi:hypothetical protein
VLLIMSDSAVQAGELSRGADPQELLILERWTNTEAPAQVLSDPAFGAAFAHFFSAPPDVAVWLPDQELFAWP